MTGMEEEELQRRIGCEVVKKVKYLGIFVTKKIQSDLRTIMKG